jgi:predicted metal-dependent peptidase
MTSRRRTLPPAAERAVLSDEGLRAPDDLAEAIMDIRMHVAGDAVRDGIVQPRYGVLSLKARSTPMYVYDHPALKEVSATSFTDGRHLFINADFMRKLMDEEDASGGTKEGVIPLILHNLSHMILRHHHRFENFPSLIADIGADLSINAKLRLAYPDMQWVPSLLEVSPGASLPPAELRRVAKLAEETIIRQLMSAHNALEDAKNPPSEDEEEDDAPQSQDNASDEQDPSGKKKPQDGEKKPGEKGDGEKQKGEKGEKGEESDSDGDDANGDESDQDGQEQDGQQQDGQKQKGQKGQPGGEPGDGSEGAQDGEGQDQDGQQPGGEGGEPSDGSEGQSGDVNEDGEPSGMGGEREGAPQDARAPGKPKKSRAARKINPESLKELLQEMKAGGEDAAEGNNASHSIPLQQMAELLEDNNLSSTQERLEIPDSEDAETLAEIEEKTKLQDIHDIARSVRTAGQRGTMGGGHIEAAAHEMVKKMTEGKISWKLGMQQAILGDGMKFAYSEEVPGDLYYVEPSDMGLGMELFVGQDLPHKNEQVVLVLLDTSGSITQELFDMFLSEILALAKSQNPESDQASEVIMLMCDDVLRGQPVIIDESNADEIRERGMQVQGRGGNDIGGTIRAASRLELFEEKKIRSIVYFTDLGDAPPKRTDCPPNVSLSFVCPPSDKQEEFIRAVSGFARVYPIAEGVEVMLEEEEAMAQKQLDWKAPPRRGFAF